MARTSLFASLSLLALAPLAAYAQDLSPGDSVSGLPIDAGSVLAECAATATETCSVVVDVSASRIQILASAEATGNAAASGELSASFAVTPSTSGNPAALIGSVVSASVARTGLLDAAAVDANASSRVVVNVIDDTAGMTVGSAPVADQTVANASLGVDDSNTVVIPVPLQRGHAYRVQVVADGGAVGGATATAASDFLNADGGIVVSDISVSAGLDPFEQNDEQQQAIDELREDLDTLREDFDTHTHTYLTGRGTGHNNTEATTTPPTGSDASPPPPSDSSGSSQDTSGPGNGRGFGRGGRFGPGR